MAVTSVWFVSDARVMRMDETPDGQRWWGPAPVAQALPALAAMGVGPQETARRAGDAFALTATTAVVNGIVLDLARGGATVARPFWRALNSLVGIPAMTGFGVPGKALVVSADQRGILDAVEDELTPAGDALTFASKQSGEPINLFAPAAMFSNGVIAAYQPFDLLFHPEAGIRLFDTDKKVAEDVAVPISEVFPPLAEAGIDHIDAMFATSGDPDDWGAAPATGDVSTAVLRAVVAAAADAGPLWAATLTVRDPLPALTPETVVAWRTGPRADLYATHAAVDVDESGAVTVGDLGAFLVARFDERRAKELERRLRA
ncbi:MAG TPA: hypothetical protein VG474_17425, partial [Solirubrobacteraceae bacterium]|nr:hypothetical protein [Solirubrobacteraceae bacterium]